MGVALAHSAARGHPAPRPGPTPHEAQASLAVAVASPGLNDRSQPGPPGSAVRGALRARRPVSPQSRRRSAMLRNLLVNLWADESGAVIATEYLMLGSVVALGSAVGM